MLFLKGIRIHRGVRQHQIATLLKVSRPVVSNIENGHWNPTPAQLDTLAQFFGYPPERLLTHVDERTLVGPGAEARDTQENGR